MINIDATKFNLEKVAAAAKDPNDPGVMARAYAEVANIQDDPIRIFMGNAKSYTNDDLFETAYGVGLMYHAIMKNIANGECIDPNLMKQAASHITRGAHKYVIDPDFITLADKDAAAADAIDEKIEWLTSQMILRIAVSRLAVTEKLCGETARTVRYE